MPMRRDLPLLMTFVAVAACTKAEGDPGFGTMEPGSSDDAGSTSEAGGKGDDTVGSSDGSPEDASTPVTKPRDSGSTSAETGSDVSATEDADTDAASAGDPETGRLEGITAAHNAVRAMVSTQPPLPDLTWSPTLAAYAQAWATQLASSPSTCAAPVHRFSGDVSTAQQAVSGWASEVSCWTYGTILGTEQCNMTCSSNLHSDGCGHYTQIVWRKSLLLGCGVATCMNGQATEDIWICNYSPAGNVVGQAPY
jgi:pathogenesis-related protein 1